ncbi:glycosyltransferase family 2 protein [Pseudonocardia nigra]|uniref:glycosyltransferase family 2 protein n=1 Tax=Pseudonocardia nigra TaxID=1921578 RepID=UPI0027E28D41|nr:glycosyltransferase family A protein [Pseudonocardia nigra]
MSTAPQVCIGIPVYNGAKYIAASIEASLAQTYSDIEVVVADNASTDETAAICAEFAARDPRFRYVRFSEHLGVAESFTRTFGLCHSKYFMWAASDDLTDPTFVEKAIEVLERRPDAVVCYSETAIVDDAGEVLRKDEFMLDLDHPSPSTRFHRMVMAPPKVHGAHELYGLIRTDVMRQTGVMSNHVMGCRVLLAELALRGRLARIDEILFLNRDHGGRSQRAGRPHAKPGQVLTAFLPIGAWPPSEFWNPRKRGRIVFPEFDITGQWLLAVLRSPVSLPAKLRCFGTLAWTLVWRAPKFGRDVAIGTEQAVRLAAKGQAPWRGGLHEYLGDYAQTSANRRSA